MKNFLDQFANNNNLTEPIHWMNVSTISIKKVKGGSGLLTWYGYSILNMLIDAYPSVPWKEIDKKYKEENKLKTNKPLDLNKTRKLFDQIGNEIGVKSMEDWYNVPVAKIREKTNIIRQFKNKLECFKASKF